jgi:hypothetical protein
MNIEYGWFLVAFSCMLNHELDAIRTKEWRMIPPLDRLPDELGYQIFTALHLPLFFGLLVGFFGMADMRYNTALINGFNWFCIIHLGMHILIRNHPNNQFHSIPSWIWIAGAALAGAIDLAL